MDRIPELTVALIHPDIDRRAQAAHALGESNDLRGVAPLIELLHSKDRNDQDNASLALQTMGKIAVVPLISALRDPDPNIRERVASILLALSESSSIAVFDEVLTQALHDRKMSVRCHVATFLGRTGDTRAIEPLIAALRDNESDVKVNAADALGKFKDSRATDALLSALNGKDKRLRRSAALALAETGDLRAIDFLIAMLKDHDSKLRKVAARALGLIGNTKALSDLDRLSREGKRSMFEMEVRPDLGRVDLAWDWQSEVFLASDAAKKIRLRQLKFEQQCSALHDGDLETRQRIAIIFAELRDPIAVEPLTAALSDSEEVVRKLAARALFLIPDSRAVTSLISALSDSKESVRLNAILALGKIGDPRAVPYLERVAFQETDPSMKNPVGWWAKAAADNIKKVNRDTSNA